MSGSGVYTSTVDVGKRDTYDLTGLKDCTEYWIAASAYNLKGSSEYSNEVACWPRPRVSSLTCLGEAPHPLGTATTCTITGDNLRVGAVVSLTDGSGTQPSGVNISNPRITEFCHALTFDVTLEGSSICSGGCTLDLRVTNPSQVASIPIAAFTISEPPAAPTGVVVH
jgi:hypothetical protein